MLANMEAGYRITSVAFELWTEEPGAYSLAPESRFMRTVMFPHESVRINVIGQACASARDVSRPFDGTRARAIRTKPLRFERIPQEEACHAS